VSIRRNHLANLSVRSKLLINQLVATLLLAALFASAWSGFDSILARGQAATDLERASAALQLVMRGTTEFIVTEGTPSSRKLAQAGIERFDALLANSIAKDSDRLAQEVSPKWHKARKDLLEFLAIPVGKIGVNNDSAMLRFGALTSDVDLIVKTMSDATKSAQEAADADKRQTPQPDARFSGRLHRVAHHNVAIDRSFDSTPPRPHAEGHCLTDALDSKIIVCGAQTRFRPSFAGVFGKDCGALAGGPGRPLSFVRAAARSGVLFGPAVRHGVS